MLDVHTWPHYISIYGYLAVFLLSIFEGPLVTVFAAFLAAQNILSVFIVFPTVVAGDLVGDAMLYAVGRGLIHLWPRHWRVWNRACLIRVRLWRRRMLAHAGRILLMGKLTQAAGFAVLVTAGVARIRFRVFLGYNLVGTLLKSSVLVAIGYFFGRFYQDISRQFQLASLVALAIGTLILLYMARRLWERHNGQKELK